MAQAYLTACSSKQWVFKDDLHTLLVLLVSELIGKSAFVILWSGIIARLINFAENGLPSFVISGQTFIFRATIFMTCFLSLFDKILNLQLKCGLNLLEIRRPRLTKLYTVTLIKSLAQIKEIVTRHFDARLKCALLLYLPLLCHLPIRFELQR
jgi:hypothetical protein